MVDHPQHGRLARPRGAQNGDDLTRFDGQIDTPEDFAVAIGFPDLAAIDKGACVVQRSGGIVFRQDIAHDLGPLGRAQPLGDDGCGGFGGLGRGLLQQRAQPQPFQENRRQAGAAVAVGVHPVFQIGLHQRDHRGHQQIDHAGGGEDGEELEGLADDLLRPEGQFVDEDHRSDRGHLQQDDGKTGEPRQDRPQRLRHDDPAQGLRPGHAQRGCRHRLLRVHRQDAAADDFGGIGGGGQRKGDHRGGKAVELQPDGGQGVEDEHQLQQLGGAAQHPDIEPGAAAQQRVARHPRQRHAQAQNAADEQREERDLHGQNRASPQKFGREIAQDVR